ncbi:MAG: sulfatase-like hydrolase/transferase [Solirubrobacterales bacterium]
MTNNLVLIVTDQERAPMHWPGGFADRLDSRSRLLANGVSFSNAICNTAMCSPSRATFITGLMPNSTTASPTLHRRRPRLLHRIGAPRATSPTWRR